MSENIFNSIKKAEESAELSINRAKKEALDLVQKAKIDKEKNIESFRIKLNEDLKKTEKEIRKKYMIEAEEIRKNKKEISINYLKNIEKRLPEIEKKINELIRKELCL